MIEFLKRLFSSNFLPHGTCYLWDPAVLWLNTISDGLIALAYYAIPVLLFVFARKRRDLTFHWIFLAFGAFILACGTTHLLAVWTVWHPIYRLDGLVKAFTAAVSLATAGLMVPLLPKLASVPAPAQIDRINRILDNETAERDEATQVLLQQAGLLDLAHDAIMVRRLDGTLLFWNRGAEVMYGWPKNEALGRVAHDLLQTRYPVPIERILSQLSEVGRWEGELIHTKRDGARVIVASRWARRRARDNGIEILEINTDITLQKAAEDRLRDLNQQLEQRVIERTAELRTSNEHLRDEMARRRALEEQLLQSQKMEAIGQLAGGVAHDFNNLLTIIVGHARLLQEELAAQSPSQERMTQLLGAADRAAGLVNQLLAFSRRQIVQPRPLNLNSIVEKAGRMLHRIISEDIRLVTTLSPDLENTKVDPGQIEQVLLNLIINAKDAMPRGGTITIETANIGLDAGRSGLPPGKYVMLAVSDTGIGMDAALQSRIFEPFFTTKGPGKGTGLGLSTVYGIVKQNQGEISVASEPGLGSTFRVYLPQFFDFSESVEPAAPSARMLRGTETILLVEDETEVRKLARDILTRQGYTVLECASGEEALECCAQYRAAIHLVLTDVVMPGMTGGQLGERLHELYPTIKVLYMTAYAEDDVVHHGPVDVAVALLHKPFTPQTLTQKVRQVLDPRKAFTILVVDDEADLRHLVREMLERDGYRVSEAGNSQEAFDQLRSAAIDILLTDVVISEAAPTQPAQSLSQQYPNLKIVLMSGASKDRVQKAAARLGAHAALPKPIQGQQLLDTVQKLLGPAA
jgi:PAS domain S-box-containing protein